LVRSVLDQPEWRHQPSIGQHAERLLLVSLQVRRSAQQNRNDAVATGVPSDSAPVAVDDHERLPDSMSEETLRATTDRLDRVGLDGTGHQLNRPTTGAPSAGHRLDLAVEHLGLLDDRSP
jgi:hypothetical protein